MVPAYTFDNVQGQFPIGFKIWNTNQVSKINEIKVDVYDKSGNFILNKTFFMPDKKEYIHNWISSFNANNDYTGFLSGTNGNDFQQNAIVYLLKSKEQMANPHGTWIK